MPSLGADMEYGTIMEWRVRPGDTVRRGDIIAVVDTEKSTIEVEVFEDGVVEELLVDPDVEVPVGTPLARIAPAGEAAAPGPVPEAEPPVAAAPAEASSFVRASPFARRQAAERGVDLAAVVGTGPDGAVLAGDVPQVAPAAPGEPSPSAEAASRQVSMRHAIGALMARSKREIPHYYLATTVDLAGLLDLLSALNADRPPAERVLPAAAFLRATAVAAREVPALNGHWDDAFIPATSVRLGVAVALRGGGLVAPAIHDADRLALDEVMTSTRDLVGRARGGGLRSSEMADPTITVTNLGDQGVDEVFGVIFPPQVAMVGFGRIVERPWAVGGLLGVRPVVRVTLSADHRASDGHDGARFLGVIERLLTHPEDL